MSKRNNTAILTIRNIFMHACLQTVHMNCPGAQMMKMPQRLCIFLYLAFKCPFVGLTLFCDVIGRRDVIFDIMIIIIPLVCHSDRYRVSRIFEKFFEPTCAYARWAHMHHFLSVTW